jgi:PKD repeat protein
MRRFLAAISLTALLGGVVAACSVPPGTTPQGSNFRFTVNRIGVVEHNDTLLYGKRDEVFAVNLWFRVKVNQPNSAQVGIAGNRSAAFNDLGDGESRALPANEQATVGFNNLRLLDVGDLLNTNNKLEIVGSWTWAMEKDDVSIAGVQANIQNVVKNALNATVAAGTLPEDPADLVPVLMGDFGEAFDLVAGALFSNIPGIPDDAVGSRFYIGVGSTGTLSNIIDLAAQSVSFPSVAIPVVSVPPDIDGGAIFSLGHNNSFTGQVMGSGDGRHDYDVSMVNVATLPQPPVASFTATPSSSASAPASVSFDSSASNDPDGTIVARNWNFGDFTTGSGAAPGHTFNTAGTFPVTLTVTDDYGMSSSTTVNVSVGGAPTMAPTGLTLTGAGCCDTYGDFAWNQVPGATAYEISMDGYFGGGCVSDHGAVINGQVPVGRVQQAGLCLGSWYHVSIRAQANGQWGPWSPAIHVQL